MHAINWQAWITTLLVAGCSGYALWNLMPRAWRVRVSGWTGRPAVAAGGGCGGCDGCGSQPAAKKVAKTAARDGESPVQVVQFVKFAKPVSSAGPVSPRG